MKKQPLQKLTVSKKKVQAVIAKEKITVDDLKTLSDGEVELLSTELTRMINAAKGVDKDKFYEKIDGIMSSENRNERWENNHKSISWAISTHMSEYHIMPPVQAIADKTELSRQTVYKHLKEYNAHPLFIESQERHKVMHGKLLARLYSFAFNGNVKAAKLYFELTGGMPQPTSNNTVIGQQNNYIQINNTVVNQDTVKQLTSEQLNQIERIIRDSKQGVL